MSSNAADVAPIIGAKLTLRYQDGRRCHCGAADVTIGRGAGPHVASLVCRDCGRFRTWMAERIATALIEPTKIFGLPQNIVVSLGANPTMCFSANNVRIEMPLVTDVYRSRFLKVDDVKSREADNDGRPWRVHIAGVRAESLQDPTTKVERQKLVASLKGVDQGLIINQTNSMALKSAYGNNTDNWIGAVVDLSTAMTGLGKEGIFLRVIKSKTPQEPPPFDDDIPDNF